MQVSVEKTSELSRKMTVQVPESLVKQKIAEKLRTLSNRVKIDGFRPGKAPQQMVEKIYGAQVREEVTYDLIQSTFYKAVNDQSINFVGEPHINDISEKDGFTYTAEFEVYPEISITGMEQLEIIRPVASVEEKDVDDMIEKLREQRKVWTEADRPSKAKDRVTVNFSGIADGKNFTEGTAKNLGVVIGDGQMIPGFEDNLIGLSKGENKSFTVTFPEDYGREDLAGKEAEFEVEVVSVESPVLPEIDEEFIKAYLPNEMPPDSFRDAVRANMERELEQALFNQLKNNALDAVYEKIKVPLPAALIANEIQAMKKPYIESANRQKIKGQDFQLPDDIFKPGAERRVALGLILAEIIRHNQIKLDEDKVRTTVESMAANYEQPEAFVKWHYEDKSRLQNIEQMVLENQTVEWILAIAKITDETKSFSDIMGKNQRT